VILDEAQDLSPMECRMIARRAEYASMTIVGDLGQATHPLAAGSSSELLARLGRRDTRTLELRTIHSGQLTAVSDVDVAHMFWALLRDTC
jgi:DNA helicase IV